MSDWALTLGLQNLRNQMNAAFPDRDKTSDGTIGDKAHQAETSGHNPDDTAGSRPEWNGDADSSPEVRAWDMDSDLRADPATAQQVVDHIRNLPGVSSVLRYVIYNRKIYKAANGWKAEAYTGPSPHTEHIHFSGAYSQAADNDTSFNYRLEEIPVALTQADKDWIDARINAVRADISKVDDNVWNHPLEDPTSTTTPKTGKPASSYVRYADVIATGTRGAITDIVVSKTDELKATIEALPQAKA